MSWYLSMTGHHDDATHNGPASPSLKTALQHFIEELRGQGHEITSQPTVNSQPVAVDVTTTEGQSTP